MESNVDPDDGVSSAGPVEHYATPPMSVAPHPPLMPGDASIAESPRGPWGFWPTIGFSLLVALLFFGAQTVVTVPFVFHFMAKHPGLEQDAVVAMLESNGLLLSIATCLSAPLCIGLILVLARVRRGITVREYLGLNWPGWREVGFWVLVLLGFAVVSDGLTYLLGRPILPEFMIDAYQTAGFTPLLWFAVIIAAPAVEELFFRGFLYAGIARSMVGPAGAIVLGSLAWALIHMQYDAYQMAVIFLLGLFLGAARWKSGSIIPPLAMHAAMNLLATVQAAVYQTRGS